MEKAELETEIGVLGLCGLYHVANSGTFDFFAQ